MKHKVFVSYKHADDSVQSISNCFNKHVFRRCTARCYVNEIERSRGIQDIVISKWERDGEDLSRFKDETIWTKLKEKIFDSSCTIVLISPKMKTSEKETDQWIPNEVSFSLKKTSRAGRQSQPNALVCVILPDKFGSYDYFPTSWSNVSNVSYTNTSFKIINRNCENGYAHCAQWSDFIRDICGCLDKAYEQREKAMRQRTHPVTEVQ